VKIPYFDGIYPYRTKYDQIKWHDPKKGWEIMGNMTIRRKIFYISTGILMLGLTTAACSGSSQPSASSILQSDGYTATVTNVSQSEISSIESSDGLSGITSLVYGQNSSENGEIVMVFSSTPPASAVSSLESTSGITARVSGDALIVDGSPSALNALGN
jgi:hypothetical protein